MPRSAERSLTIIIQGDYIAGDKVQGDKIEGDKYDIDRVGNLNTGDVISTATKAEKFLTFRTYESDRNHCHY